MMNKEDYISTLPQTERKALSVCGIIKAEQLRNISLHTLASELEHAGEIFKGEIIPISRERLSEIFNAACNQQSANFAQEQQEEFQSVPATETIAKSETERLLSKRKSPQLKPETRDIIYSFEEEPTTGRRRRSSNAIHNTHPYRTYIAAVLFIWLHATIVMFVITAFRFIMGIDSELNPAIIAAIPVSGLLPYLLIRRTSCPVCNHRYFTLHGFNHNKNAHKLPLLSCSLTTALHMFFFLWFRCPACGTPQKLFGKTHHKR